MAIEFTTPAHDVEVAHRKMMALSNDVACCVFSVWLYERHLYFTQVLSLWRVVDGFTELFVIDGKGEEHVIMRVHYDFEDNGLLAATYYGSDRAIDRAIRRTLAERRH